MLPYESYIDQKDSRADYIIYIIVFKKHAAVCEGKEKSCILHPISSRADISKSGYRSTIDYVVKVIRL